MIYIKELPTKKMPGITSLFISFEYNQSIINELTTFPTKIFHKKEKLWEIPLSYATTLIETLIKFDDINLITLEDIKCNSLISLDESSYLTKPFEYQKEAIKYGLTHSNWLLLDAPGLGKTLDLILLMQELKKRNNYTHCLIICGINTLKKNWIKEIKKHSKLSATILGSKINKKGNLIIGSIQDRINHLNSDISEFFIITNIETLRNDKIIEAINNTTNKIDCIIVDEIHTIKSPDSIQGKNLLKLTANNKIGATGTLLMKNPLDLYMPLSWLGLEKSTFGVFKNHYCIFTGPFNNILVGYKNLDLLKYQLQQYSLRRTIDIMKLPLKTIIPTMVEMDDSQSAFYNRIKEGVVSELETIKVNKFNIRSLLIRLRQATSCPNILTLDDIPCSKIKYAVDLAHQIIDSGEKVVIFSSFKDTVYKLKELLNDLNPLICTGDQLDEEVSNNIDTFQNDNDHKVLIGTWQKIGTGVTLNRAHYMIHVDTAWSYALFEQTCDRIYRIGTSSPVFIYVLINTDTVDEIVWDLVNVKKALSEYVIDDELTTENYELLTQYIENL